MAFVRRIGSPSTRVFPKGAIDFVEKSHPQPVSISFSKEVLYKLFTISCNFVDEYAFQNEAEYFRFVFRSDNSTQMKGFQIRYKLLSDCRHGLYWVRH